MKIAKTFNKPEAYLAVQGEGRSAGTPTVFLRLFNCSLRCSFCDSKHSYAKDNVIDLKPREVAKMVKKLAGKKIQHLTVTGGEPLLQQDEIVELIYELNKGQDELTWVVEIETNGTIKPSPIVAQLCSFNCSPKLANSGNPEKARFRKDALTELNMLDTIFKFVISNREDLKEAQGIIKKIGISDYRVWLMPEGTTRNKVIDGLRDLVPICQKYNYNLSTRMQVILYGKKLNT